MRLRAEFDVYSDGLFALPLNLPGTPFGKAVRARAFIVEQIAGLIRGAQAAAAAGQVGDARRRNALQLLLDAQDENGDKVGAACVGPAFLFLVVACMWDMPAKAAE